jgi:hypothetical protein
MPRGPSIKEYAKARTPFIFLTFLLCFLFLIYILYHDYTIYKKYRDASKINKSSTSFEWSDAKFPLIGTFIATIISVQYGTILYRRVRYGQPY